MPEEGGMKEAHACALRQAVIMSPHHTLLAARCTEVQQPELLQVTVDFFFSRRMARGVRLT